MRVRQIPDTATLVRFATGQGCTIRLFKGIASAGFPTYQLIPYIWMETCIENEPKQVLSFHGEDIPAIRRIFTKIREELDTNLTSN